MNLLLDTHTLLWWMTDNPRLSLPARRAIADETNGVLVSAATAWELATKHRIGKLPDAEGLLLGFRGHLAEQAFEELAITVADAHRAGGLPLPLRDPFDRMLIAQALLRDLILVSNEAAFDSYGVRRLW